jgi:hypothetical protein
LTTWDANGAHMVPRRRTERAVEKVTRQSLHSFGPAVTKALDGRLRRRGDHLVVDAIDQQDQTVAPARVSSIHSVASRASAPVCAKTLDRT